MPETASNNPLRKFFRQPAIYVKLPSKGQFYSENSIDMPVNNELPVFPMTAMDEITYRTADALFNGSAVVSVIKSCVPNIKDPWQIPSMDVDTLLVAIRIASYGHEMEFESECPHCQHENSFGLDLRSILDSIKSPDYTEALDHGDIQIFFRPMTYQQVNSNAMLQFEDQKLLETLPKADLPEDEKMKLLTEAFAKLTDMTMNAISQSISVIKAGGELVSDKQHIEEFIKNCERETFNRIRNHIVQLREASELKPLTLKCNGCQKDYTSPFTLDVANFFDSAS
jgi:hypothetical protein